MNIYFDIETIPAQDASHISALTADMDRDRDAALAAVKAPGNYKDPAKIAEFVEAGRASIIAAHESQVADAILRTSFDGGLGQIVCIGWAIDEAPAQSVQVDPGDLSVTGEGSILRAWFAEIRGSTSGTRPCLIGHNSNAFDIPFLWKRAIVHGVQPPLWFPRDPKPWVEATFDTMTAWAGARERISMDRLCRILGIDGKGGMDGSKVWPLVQAGRIAEVAAYCRGDVERTRAIHRRMTFASVALRPNVELSGHRRPARKDEK